MLSFTPPVLPAAPTPVLNSLPGIERPQQQQVVPSSFTGAPPMNFGQPQQTWPPAQQPSYTPPLLGVNNGPPTAPGFPSQGLAAPAPLAMPSMLPTPNLLPQGSSFTPPPLPIPAGGAPTITTMPATTTTTAVGLPSYAPQQGTIVSSSLTPSVVTQQPMVVSSTVMTAPGASYTTAPATYTTTATTLQPQVVTQQPQVVSDTVFKGVFSMVPDTQVTLCPYFEVHDMQGFMHHARHCTELTKKESMCNYYGFTFCGDAALCRESYTSADGLLAHLRNIDEVFREGLLSCANLVRMEVHGPPSELEKLKGPMAELGPDFYELMDGAFLVKEGEGEGPMNQATVTYMANGQVIQGAATTTAAPAISYGVTDPVQFPQAFGGATTATSYLPPVGATNNVVTYTSTVGQENVYPYTAGGVSYSTVGAIECGGVLTANEAVQNVYSYQPVQNIQKENVYAYNPVQGLKEAY